MRTPFIAGNWKMNFTLDQAIKFLMEIKGKLPKPKITQTALAASPLFLEAMLKVKANSPLIVSGEDCFYKNKGPYTGQVSPYALSKMGITHCMVGHSESRKLLNETDNIINKKVHAIFNNKMIPILCCDETVRHTHGENENDDKVHWIVSEVAEALKGISKAQVVNIIIAYEPSWAIGSKGHPASTSEAQEGCYLIRQTIMELYSSDVADQIRVLYGGSVSPKNIKALMAQNDIDGILAGRSSLDPKEFLELANYQQL